jgi:hypothetical protein
MFWSCCIVFGQNPSCSVTDSGKLPYLDKPAGPVWQIVNPKQPANSEGQYYNLAGKRSNPVFSPACICGLLAALLTACAVQSQKNNGLPTWIITNCILNNAVKRVVHPFGAV